MTTSDTSPLLAGTFTDCCFTAFKHEGDPVGRIETIAGFQTYLSDPPADTTGPKKVILFFSDVYGPFYNTAKLLQDFFASHGFYVLGVDYFFGDYYHHHRDTPGYNLVGWVENKLKEALSVTPKWIDEVRKIHGEDALYCSVGYCFGGPFTTDLAATDKVVAAAFAHPAFITEDQFRKVKKPLLLSCAETDHTFPTHARHKAEDILAEVKATYYVQVFSGVEHGFTRGDTTVENIRWARQQSAESIVAWFKRFIALETKSS
ncbi:alpha/beta-hydrolase [Pholiota conissans]|uniref:Alpha/beta-hydrolase n=1 Tax=Pholiota conissans TaxID=109636 RepID=A0A9P6D341_9AGAR|nr:alpha/beta-hydrolase [Pholiota conissans]